MAECTCGNLPDYSIDITAQKATQAMNKAAQDASKAMDTAIENLQKAMEKLMKIIAGWENTDDPEFDPTEIIDSITALLDPVISALNSLPVPSIPGLSDLSTLLDALKSAQPTGKPSKGKVSLPSDLLSIIQDLLICVSSMCATLPMVLISLIFDMLNALISPLASLISIPYPLSIVPDAVKAVPDILKAVGQLPGKLSTAVMATLKKQIKALSDLAIPSVPDDIEIKAPEKCPIHG